MKTMKKIAPAVILFAILLTSMIPNDLFNSTEALSEDSPIDDLLFNDEEDKTQVENILDNLPSPNSAATYVAGWWNGSFQYRTRVELTNNEAFSQAKPIDLYLEFDSGVAHIDSVRVVKFSIENEIETWTPTPSQLWNESVGNPDADHLGNATVTFVVNYLTAGTTVYYVYYDDDSQVDTTDYSDQIFTADLVGQDLTVNWDDVYDKDYRLSLSKNYGATELVDQYLNNLHTDNSSSPGSATLDKDLVAYWSFDDDTSTEQTGYIPGGSGTGYIAHGNAAYADSQTNYGRALVLDGTGDYVAINADHTEMGGYGTQFDEGITIMAWIYLDAAGSGERIIASWDRSEYWRFSIDSGNHLYFSSTGTNIDDFYGSTVLSDDTWYHVAAVYDPATGTKSVYVNGVQDGIRVGAHTPGNTLHPSTINHPRYGFFGTGSEASSFDGAAAPANYFEGKMDEIRVYNDALDEDRIDAASTPNQLGYINAITEVKNGPVLAIYDVEWYPIEFNGGLMDVVDSWYFYRSLNMWKVSRTYSFNYVINEPTNFGAFHTLFNWDTNDPDISKEDYYFYDGQSHESHDDLTFTPNNYTVVYDYDGDYRYNALGLFITNISESYPLNGFSDVEWRVDTDDVAETVNFVPGNYTNLINLDLGDNITIEFWEFLRTDYVATPGAANTYFENVYTALSQETTT
ncbi:MAG: LamG domain-containing protein, partial [Promethearchaeota archaeon]